MPGLLLWEKFMILNSCIAIVAFVCTRSHGNSVGCHKHTKFMEKVGVTTSLRNGWNLPLERLPIVAGGTTSDIKFVSNALAPEVGTRRLPTQALQPSHGKEQQVDAPSVGSHKTLLSDYKNTTQFTRVMEMFEAMRRQGVVPNETHTRAFINEMAHKKQQPQHVMEIFEAMQHHGLVSDGINCDVLISACQKHPRLMWSMMVLRALAQQGVMPNISVYSAIIKGYEKNDQSEKDRDALEMIQRQRSVSNFMTYSALITACKKAQNPTQARQVFEELQRESEVAGIVNYTTWISMLEKNGNQLERPLNGFDAIKLEQTATKKIISRQDHPPQTTSNTLSLGQHLLSLKAPRAAVRLGLIDVAAKFSSSLRKRSSQLPVFTVPHSRIQLVDTVVATAAFVREVKRLLTTNSSTVAIDAEWQPDLGSNCTNHQPSLLQVATPKKVWLLDLEQPRVLKHNHAPLLWVAKLLASNRSRILGFSLQADLNKLQLLCTPAHGFEENFVLSARRAVDLQDACNSVRKSSDGLSVQLARHIGCTLDKREQRSDWHRRPLSAEQVSYAAADAACLLELDDALATTGTSPDPRVELHLNAISSNSSGQRNVTEDEAALSSQLNFDNLERVRSVVQVASSKLPRHISNGTSIAPSIRLIEWDLHQQQRWRQNEGTYAEHDRIEINSLCLKAGLVGLLLVLVPASERVEIRWLDTLLNVPRRKLKLASADECVDRFGVSPGLVPPLPLRSHVHVVCHPSLVEGNLTSLWASSGHPGYRLLIDQPRLALPALVAAAADQRDDNSILENPEVHTLDGSLAFEHLPKFAWLPTSRHWHASLEDALEKIHERRFVTHVVPEGPLFGEAVTVNSSKLDVRVKQSPRVKLIMPHSLQRLARKLRMVGIDTAVAGEIVKHQESRESYSPFAVEAGANGQRKIRLSGLRRVGYDSSIIEAQFRRAAFEGRLIVVSGTREGSGFTRFGATYRLLASDVSGQFAEMLTVLGLTDAANMGGSRCGICNGNDWCALKPHQVPPGKVPAVVLNEQPVVYLCGRCQQIFWPGTKYESIMEGLREESS